MKDYLHSGERSLELIGGCISAMTRIGGFYRTKNMTKSLAILQGFFSNILRNERTHIMPDILQDAAKAYENLLKYDYSFVFGDKKRNKMFTIINNDEETFTHICGLDHFNEKGRPEKNAEKVFAKNSAQKKQFIKKYLIIK